MSQYERGFHPLSLVEDVTPKITFDLGLPPYVNPDKIGVNVRGLHRMMRVGGISNLQVVGTSGETSSFNPTIVGYSPDGTAYAGKSGTAKIVPTYSVESESHGDNHSPIATKWIDAKVELNIDEVQERISGRNVPLRSTQAWGKELDNAVRNGVADAGVAHVIFDTSVYDKFLFGSNSCYGTVIGAEGLGLASGLTPGEGVVVENLLYHGLSNVLNRFFYHLNPNKTEGFRWSLFSGPQLDRACILKGMSQTGRVIKGLPHI